MRVSGPDRYVLTITPTSFAVECSRGTPRFSGIAASRKPKLYVVSVDESPIYVGITKAAASKPIALRMVGRRPSRLPRVRLASSPREGPYGRLVP